MRLAVWISRENLSFTDFGKLREPPVPRCTVRQWALGLRFPKAVEDLAWIAAVTKDAVTAQDFLEHRLEVRRQVVAA